MKTTQILIAGFGGQGILFAGKFLAYKGLLEDLQPDSDFKTLCSPGAAKRWGDKGKVTKDKKAELDTAFEACMMDGEVTVYALAEYMDLKPRTIKTRLKDDGRFWIDGEKVGRKEPGSAG